jgi:Trypsin-like serine proteases, typically periplasmic, contain C-terminal PDZ domain
MLKTKSVLRLIFVIVLAGAVYPQSPDNVTFKITVVDKALNMKNVPKFVVVVRKRGDSAFSERRVSTALDGLATLLLSPGDYVAASANPLVFEDKTFAWEQPFKVESGKAVTVELSNDNAKIGAGVSDSAASAPRRRISEVAELFKTLRNGVVTIEAELGSGTGFIIDKKGLVLTNQHVISETSEIRVRFDKHTSVKARLLATDVERDLAILQINLAAFPNSTVLKIAENSPTEPPLFEGEQVFTIGSPLEQEKILTTGIVSKLEARAIISDINFSSGNSGGPLFNSIGEVVGVTSFNLTGKDGSGLAGIVRIEESAALIAKAREMASTKGTPSAELMPNLPEGVFPVETIKTALSAKDFPVKQYVSDVKNYEIKYMTPIYKFYAIEKDRIDSLKIREKRNKVKGGSADMFRDLRSYSEYAGELLPVVDILALPETTPTAKSLILSAATSAMTGYATPFDLKYKADFSQMKLMCDGKEVTPLRRNKTEIDRNLQNYYKVRKRYTYAGVYTYPYEIFAPGRCREMKLQVFSEEDIEEPITTIVNDLTKNRVWSDFQDFRTQGAIKP